MGRTAGEAVRRPRLRPAPGSEARDGTRAADGPASATAPRRPHRRPRRAAADQPRAARAAAVAGLDPRGSPARDPAAGSPSATFRRPRRWPPARRPGDGAGGGHRPGTRRWRGAAASAQPDAPHHRRAPHAERHHDPDVHGDRCGGRDRPARSAPRPEVRRHRPVRDRLHPVRRGPEPGRVPGRQRPHRRRVRVAAPTVHLGSRSRSRPGSWCRSSATRTVSACRGSTWRRAAGGRCPGRPLGRTSSPAARSPCRTSDVRRRRVHRDHQPGRIGILAVGSAQPTPVALNGGSPSGRSCGSRSPPTTGRWTASWGTFSMPSGGGSRTTAPCAATGWPRGGSAMTTPPDATAPALANLRDVGGHPGRGGERIRTGLLYRSMDLGGLDDAGSRPSAGSGSAPCMTSGRGRARGQARPAAPRRPVRRRRRAGRRAGGGMPHH